MYKIPLVCRNTEDKGKPARIFYLDCQKNKKVTDKQAQTLVHALQAAPCVTRCSQTFKKLILKGRNGSKSK